MRTTSRALVAAVAGCMAVLAMACTKSDPPPVASGSASTAAPVTDDTRPPEDEPFTYAELRDLAIEDVQAYWAETFPEVYGAPYEPIPDRRLYPATEDAMPPPCGGYEFTYEEVAGNAFYCSDGDYITWGEDGLFPELYENYGPYTVALVLAHEWGHAVQARADVFVPSVVLELQADCFAGGWTRHVADGNSERLELDAKALEQGLAGLLEFRDPPGTDPGADSAHGSAFDRINAFQEGFEQGPLRCAEYQTEPPLVVALPFSTEEEARSGGNMTLDDVLETAAVDLNDFFGAVQPGFEPIEELQPYDPDGALPTCDGDEYARDEVTFSVFWCRAESYVGFDENLTRFVHRTIGDFAVATLLGTQWSVAAQAQAGLRSDDATTVLQRACYVGSWAGDAAVGNSSFTLSPGDLDEAIQAILAFAGSGTSLAELSSAFEQVQAFRLGFFSGFAACEA